MANGDNDPMSGLPWWMKAIVIVGVPSAIALGLVWSDRAQLSNTVQTIRTSQIEMQLGNLEHDRNVRTEFDGLNKQTAETNRILLAGCVNSATNEEQRNRCVGRR